MAITIFTIAWFAWYPAYIKHRFGILTSISASSYRLKGARKYILFTGWLGVLGILSVLHTLHVEGLSDVLFGLMGMGFAYAGVTVDHRSNPTSGEDEYHTYGTLLAILAGFGVLWVELPLLEALISTGVMVSGSAVLYLWVRNWVWWVECLAMATIGAGLLMI